MTGQTEQRKWHRSSACAGGNCVEVAKEGDRYLIRDSRDPSTVPLSFSAEEWDAFVRGVKEDEFSF
jgi:hypothetical protein